MLSWNTVLYPVSQFLHCFPGNLNWPVDKKPSAPKHDVIFICKTSYQEFPGFYASRQHINTQHDFPIRTKNVDPEKILNDFVDANLQ